MTSLKNFSLASLKGSFIKHLLFAGILLSFTACKDGLDNMYPNLCVVSEEEKQTQKQIDLELLTKHFTENNINAADFQVTASGLHYKVLTAGAGETIKAGDKIDVHYIGKLLDGSTFDSSYGRAEAFRMNVGANEVIAGWEEAVKLMKVGEEARFYIPSHIAYGRCGSGNIGPNAVLMFDIKVIRKL